MDQAHVERIIPPRFLAEFSKRSKTDQKQAIKALRLFERDPGHPSLRLKKRESDGHWEISFSKDGQMLLDWADEQTRRKAVFLAIGHHKIVE
jgi:hypothetical protein